MSNRSLQIQSDHFINRELSWLEFNDNVLQEALDASHPLLERCKFLSIVSSNLDEFYMIRVASLREQLLARFTGRDASGMTPAGQLSAISSRAKRLVADQYRIYGEVCALLDAEGIRICPVTALADEPLAKLAVYFSRELFPVLTPLVVDKSRPFPLIFNRSLNVGVLVQDANGPVFANVQVPSAYPRMLALDGQPGVYVDLADVIIHFLPQLFRGYRILAAHPYRITRNADLGYDEEDAEDLLEVIEKTVKQRKWGAVIRLETSREIDPRLLSVLIDELEVPDEGLFLLDGPLDLTFLMRLYGALDIPALKDRPMPPLPAADLLNKPMLEAIARQDALVHHPYETFAPVMEFVRHAARDPQVVAIKQTLYRVSGDSPIINALAEAVENGKQVTVLVELKARFDEENNIHWARRLEKAGCNVIYGLVGLKTHCKVTLVIRREDGGLRQYAHFGTGNYNDVTASLYTDIGLFTIHPDFTADAGDLFNRLSGYCRIDSLRRLTVAPENMREKFLSLIYAEAERARNGERAGITAKMNSLVDEEIITALYHASQAGVHIRLNIRGICCLRPGIPGVSEHIQVVSIVGRFLEHSRIFLFENAGDPQYFISSADWMPRNLNRRIELLVPVIDPRAKDRLLEILDAAFSDTAKARHLQPDGKYKRSWEIGFAGPLVSSQAQLYQRACERVTLLADE